MVKEKSLVINANGNTGFPIAKFLLAKKYAVRVLVRTQTKNSDYLKEKGAEVHLGRFTETSVLRAALHGVQRAYYNHPIIPGVLKHSTLFAEIASENKLEAVVNMGQYLAELPYHPSVTTQGHKKAYDVLDSASIGAIHLCPGMFSANFLAAAAFVTQLGLFPFPLGKGRTTPVLNLGHWTCSCCVVDDPEGHIGKYLQPTGSQSVSGEDMARIFSSITGKKVRYIDGMEPVFHKAAKFFGLSAYMISQLRLYLESFRNNVFDYAPNNVVPAFKNAPANSFEITARKYFEQRNLLHRTWSSRTRAFVDFIKIGFANVPGKSKLIQLNTSNAQAG
jgi:NAD(P)H dehydrogenase (quinone)